MSKKTQSKVEPKSIEKYPCFVCGRITVDPEGCPVHKVVEEVEEE